MFTYHENLLKHVGHVSAVWEGQTSLGKKWRGDEQLDLFAKCESGVLTGVDSGLYIDDRFKTEKCPNKAFSPCHVSHHKKISNFDIFLSVIAGIQGKSCDESCPKPYFSCAEKYFNDINSCDIMDKIFYNDGTVHECIRENGQALPLVNDGKMYLKNNIFKLSKKNDKLDHKFDLRSTVTLKSLCRSTPEMETAFRLCPCIHHDINRKDFNKKFTLIQWLAKTFYKTKQILFDLAIVLVILYILLYATIGRKATKKQIRKLLLICNINITPEPKSPRSPRTPGSSPKVKKKKSPKQKKKKNRSNSNNNTKSYDHEGGPFLVVVRVKE